MKTICLDRWYSEQENAQRVAGALAQCPRCRVIGLVRADTGAWGILYLHDGAMAECIDWQIIGIWKTTHTGDGGAVGAHACEGGSVRGCGGVGVPDTNDTRRSDT